MFSDLINPSSPAPGADDAVSRFLHSLRSVLAARQGFKLSLSKPEGGEPGLERLMVREIELRGERALSFLWRYKTRDITKNHALEEGVEALARLLPTYPQARLVIIGEGVERPRIEATIQRLGLQGKVRMTGALPNAELLRWYSAADMLVLASSREGWANVLLEAMACGAPAAATPVGGGLDRAVAAALEREVAR